MRKSAFLAIAVLPLVAVSQPAFAQVAGDKIPGSYICVFKKGSVGRGNAQAEANRSAQAGGGQVKHVYSVAVQGFAANIPDHALERMKAANPNIAYCEQDQVITAPPIRAEARPGGGGTQPAQETPWGIARVNGGAAGTFATAWVIDSGIELSHPDLNVDAARSRNFVANETSPNDTNGHGTHVAGTIAARDNAIGVIGVAPGAPVVAVRVLNRRGSGTNSGVIAGVDYVAQNGRPGDVANMSLGGGISTALDTAVINAAAGGVRFALAAGNESDNANNHSPARANGPNVYTVSAFGVGDRWATYSNFGNPPIEYSEPGSSIKSTWLSGGYNTISGTSMATPHLAGLMLAGAVRNGGVVAGDPDGNPDVIGVK
jgi:subtilisin family serine protease